MPDGLYERDILTWAEQQAALLRRLADGERVNELLAKLSSAPAPPAA